ncbi:MAG: BrnA antitoxin family protein [Anaerolineales bacterium]|nr:BrnA antitoxin family protein [Anaerolineales bacterium]
MSKNDTSAKKGEEETIGTDWARLESMTDEEIDLSDIPELTEEQLASMRPTAEVIPALARQGKTRITIRLDDDIVTFFKQQAHENNTNYQTLINATLHQVMVQQGKQHDLRTMIKEIVQQELAKAP